MVEYLLGRERIDNELDVEHLDVLLYRSCQLRAPLRGRGAFGGQVVGQALLTASKSVPEKYMLHVCIPRFAPGRHHQSRLFQSLHVLQLRIPQRYQYS